MRDCTVSNLIKLYSAEILITVALADLEGMLRRLLLGVRAGDSNLAKNVYAIEMYQHEN